MTLVKQDWALLTIIEDYFNIKILQFFPKIDFVLYKNFPCENINYIR